MSAVIGLNSRDVSPGAMIQECRTTIKTVARGLMGGDTLVFLSRTLREDDRVLAAHWGEISSSLDVLLDLVPCPTQMLRIVSEMRVIVSALSNPDLDKSNPAARASLTVKSLESLEVGESDVDRQAIAKAICQIVDHCVKLPGGLPVGPAAGLTGGLAGGAEECHALDGIVIAARLCGVGL